MLGLLIVVILLMFVTVNSVCWAPHEWGLFLACGSSDSCVSIIWTSGAILSFVGSKLINLKVICVYVCLSVCMDVHALCVFLFLICMYVSVYVSMNVFRAPKGLSFKSHLTSSYI